MQQHIPCGGVEAGLLDDPAGFNSTKLSGNIPVTPLSVPSHQPSSTCIGV